MMATYRKVFVEGHYVEIPVATPGWRMLEAIVRFPHVALHHSYWQLKREDEEPINAATLDLDTLKFSTRVPWTGKRCEAAARELAMMIRNETVLDLSFM
jgi:hypothetical protein